MGNKDEIISAFAFKTGRDIEQLIKDTTNDLFEKNQLLKAKIMQFRVNLFRSANVERKEALLEEIDTPYQGILSLYDKHFDINTSNQGKID